MIVTLADAKTKVCPMSFAANTAIMKCKGDACIAWTGVTNEYGVIKGLERGYCGMLPAKGGY